MDVTCSRCGTQYEFDATLVSREGTQVKCTECGNVFPIFPPEGQADRGVRRSYASVRLRDGTLLSLESLEELRGRVVRGELGPSDELSREEGPWQRLEELAELRDSFAERSRSAGAQPSAAKSASRAAHAMRTTAYEEVKLPAAQAPSRPSVDKRTVVGVGLLPPPENVGGLPSAVQAPQPAFSPASPQSNEARANEEASASADHRPAPSFEEVKPAAEPQPEFSETRPRPKLHAEAFAPLAADDLHSPPSTAPAAKHRPKLALSEEDADEGSFAREQRAAAEESVSPGRPFLRQDESGPKAKGRALFIDENDERGRLDETASSASPKRWILLVALASALALVIFNWSTVAARLGLSEEAPVAVQEAEDEVGTSLDETKAALAEDHDAAYDKAIENLKALEGKEPHAREVLRLLVAANVLRAQNLRFEAADLAFRAQQEPSLASESARARRDEQRIGANAVHYAEKLAAESDLQGEDLLWLADVERWRGRFPEARTRLQEAQSKGAKGGDVPRVRALLQADTSGGKISAGLNDAEKSAQRDASCIRCKLLAARARFAAGQGDLARREIDAILSLKPNHPTALALQSHPPAAEVTPGAATEAAPQAEAPAKPTPEPETPRAAAPARPSEGRPAPPRERNEERPPARKREASPAAPSEAPGEYVPAGELGQGTESP
mgnify:CR=1 FL=1